jgi:hypothetical protein
MICLQCGAVYDNPKPETQNSSISQASSTNKTNQAELTWLPPARVRFTMDDIYFILLHLPLLRQGVYPPDPRETGYTTGMGRKKGGSLHAYFEKPAQIAGEIDTRLTRCGLDRYLVEDNICRGIPEEDLARRLDMEVWEIRRRINSAVSYIASGPCPRWNSCIDCVKYQKCYFKKHVGMSYKHWKRSRRPIRALKKALNCLALVGT